MILGTKILVALSNPEHVEDLISLAGNLAKGNRKAQVYAIHVVVVPRALSLEAEMPQEIERGEAMLAKAEEVAGEQWGITIETDLLRAREAGPAILEEARQKGVDLIILGYSRQRRFGDRFFGTAIVDHVARHAPCRVLIHVTPARPG